MKAHINSDENGTFIRGSGFEIKIAANGDISVKTDSSIRLTTGQLEGSKLIHFPAISKKDIS